MQLIGFRDSATGVFSYTFYQNNRRICTVSSLVMPSPTVHIQGFDRAWSSPFDPDSTIFPGLTRLVYRADSDQEEYRIVYRGERYDLQIGADVYSVYTEEETYTFYAGQKRIAVITRLSRPEAKKIPVPQDEPYYDREAYYIADAASGIPENVRMAILAFPMLRFAG